MSSNKKEIILAAMNHPQLNLENKNKLNKFIFNKQRTTMKEMKSSSYPMLTLFFITMNIIF